MNHFKYLSMLLLGLVLSSCGGDNNSLTGGGTVPGQTEVASIQVISSSPILLTDQTGTDSVTISAIVRDQNNNIVEGTDLLFSATSGSIEEIENGVTNASGIAGAFLKSFGNVQNRTITVTALEPVSSVASSIVIDVEGTNLTISGPQGLAQGDTGTLTFQLQDGQGQGIAGEIIALSSANGNSFSNATPITGSEGEVQVVLTADGTSGDDTITATVLGLTETISVTVNDDVFAFTSPAPGTEVSLLPASETLTIQWQQSGVNVPDGSEVTFTADRGTLSAGTVTTSGGLASVDISAGFAGLSTITATGETIGGTPVLNGPSTQLQIEFIAETPDTVNLGAFPDLLITGEQSTLTAVVRDASGNRVKGVDVDFNIITDPSGGSLTVSSDETDSSGTATTIYRAGASTTENDGVEITATVRGTAITDSSFLTVSGRSINFVIGTGNDVFTLSPTRFGVQWVVTATDVAGVPAAGEEIRLTIRSTQYKTGDYFINVGADQWQRDFRTNDDGGTPFFSCPDEDWVGNGGNENGSLEPSEDDDGDGELDVGNIATIVPEVCEDAATAGPGSTQQSLLTDSTGSVEVCIVYPQEFNTWVDVRFTATVPIDGGTESVESRFFELPALASDFNDTDASPPGVVSPFGAPDVAPHAGCVEPF